MIEGSIAYLRGRKRTERGTFDIVLFWLLFIVMRLGKEEKKIFYMYLEILLLKCTPLHREVAIIIGAEEGPSHQFVQREDQAITLYMWRKKLPHT